MPEQLIQKLERDSCELRKQILTLASKKSIHLGGDLSIADVLTVLWQYQMKYNPANPQDEQRDRFILSKGHASAALNFCQAAIGCYPPEDVMREFDSDGGRFSMHPCKFLNPYIEFSTGSLGHGLALAAGMAMALKLKKNQKNRVYVVMGDGEQSEGSVWEAAMNAVHYKLGNLIALIDQNGLESDGFVDEITALGDIAKKYRAFGWNVQEIDGNDIPSILDAFKQLPSPAADLPTVIVCHTVKGKGVPFLENSPAWQKGKLNAEQYQEAMACLTKTEPGEGRD